MQAAKYIVPSHVSALSRLGSPVDWVRTPAMCGQTWSACLHVLETEADLSKRVISCLYGPLYRDMIIFVVLLGYVAVAKFGELWTRWSTARLRPL
jgi:hypothetical protein